MRPKCQRPELRRLQQLSVDGGPPPGVVYQPGPVTRQARAGASTRGGGALSNRSEARRATGGAAPCWLPA